MGLSKERGDAKYINGSGVRKQQEEKEVGSIEVKLKEWNDDCHRHKTRSLDQKQLEPGGGSVH